MTQAEVQKILEKEYPKWLTTLEMSKFSESSLNCISTNASRMYKFGELERKYVKIGKNKKIAYRIKK